MDIFSALGGTAWTTFFFIIALSVIVFVHEYGHYIIGRLTGIHAEVFSLGFGPVLFSWTDRRATRWQIAAIPFGGYVKFMGDADAASVTSQDVSGLSSDERRHTMAGAPLWARTATVAAGPIFNFILTFVVLAGLGLNAGVADGPPTIAKLAPTPFEGASLLPGDVILAVDGQATPDYASLSDIAKTLPAISKIDYTILRDGSEMTLAGPTLLPPLVMEVQIRSAAMDAGIKAGDVILRAGGQDVALFNQLPDIVKTLNGAPVPLTVWRNGTTFDLSITPRVRTLPLPDNKFEERLLIGLSGGLVFDPVTRTPGFGELMSTTADQMIGTTVTTFYGLWHMVTGQISRCNMSGAVGMAEAMGDAARIGVESFLTMLAVLSLGIGILNLFPVPVLDGGHLVFYAYEAIAGRPPSVKVLRVMMSVGLTLLISLMIYALGNDFTCV